MDRNSPTRQISIVAIVVGSALIPLVLILKYHVNFIWSDSWNFATLLIRSYEGTLQASDFWIRHNEHRIPIPLCIMYTLARLTSWNTLAETLFGYVMVWVLSFSLMQLLRTLAPNRWLWPWVLMHAIVFTPTQCETWLFSFCASGNFIPIPCLIGAMTILYSRPLTWSRLLLCALLVEIASLCLANGLLGWVLLAPMIALVHREVPLKRRAVFIVVWLALMAGSLWIQFAHRDQNVIASPYTQADWIERIEFFFIFIGAPLYFAGPALLEIAGTIGAILTLAWVISLLRCARLLVKGRSDEASKKFPWLALGAYALISGALGALGRAGLGADYATTSRYTTISICMLLSLSGLVLLASPHARRFQQVFAAVMLVGLIWSGFGSISTYRRMQSHFRTGLAHLSFISIINDPETQVLISTRPDLPDLAVRLDRAGYVHPPLVKDADIRRLAVDQNGAAAIVGRVDGLSPQPDRSARVFGQGRLPSGQPIQVILMTETDESGREILKAIADGVHDPSLPPDTWVAQMPLHLLPRPSDRLKFWAYAPEKQEAFLLHSPAAR